MMPSLPSVTETLEPHSGSADEPPGPPQLPPIINNRGYFTRSLPVPVHVDLFYHRLLQASRHDSFQKTLIHESFLHPALCKEWVEDYKISLNSQMPRVYLPLAATLDLALAAWLKTALKRAGSMDRNLEPCKSYNYLLLHSIWSPTLLLAVKAQSTPPYAPRLWSIVDNDPSNTEQSIEIYGQDEHGNKKLLLTGDCCHIASGQTSRSLTLTATTVTGRTSESLENVSGEGEQICQPDPLPEPSLLFETVRNAFVDTKQQHTMETEAALLSVTTENHMIAPLPVEFVKYGPAFQPSCAFSPAMQATGQLGLPGFTLLSAPLSVQHLSAMRAQYLVPPPLLELMLHQVLNTFITDSQSTTDTVSRMLPRAVAIEGLYFQYQVLSKLLEEDKMCSVMISTTRSKNIHEYEPSAACEYSDSDSEDGHDRDENVEDNLQSKVLNLDCSLLSSDGDVIVHAFNVLYCYQIEGAGGSAPQDPQVTAFRKKGASRSSKKNSSKTAKRRGQKRHAVNFCEAKSLTPEQIFSQVRSITLMFVDEVIADDAILVDQGLDSLATAELIGKLSSTFQLNLPPTLVFHHPSIREIQHVIAELLKNPETSEHLVATEVSSGMSRSVTDSMHDTDDNEQNMDEGMVPKVKDVDNEPPRTSQSQSVPVTVLREEQSHHDEMHVEEQGDTVEHRLDCEGDVELECESSLRSRVGSRGHFGGNTVQGNPWFSVFYATGPGDPKCRMILCTGQAQGTAPWFSFAEVLNDAGIDVYVMRIPGQFERGEEPPYEGTFADICTEVCDSLAILGCLDDEQAVPISLDREEKGKGGTQWKSPAIPLVMLGFSLGTCFTAGIAQCLQRTRGVHVAQIVSIGGLTYRKMKTLKSQTVPYTPTLLVETLVTFFGRAPNAMHEFLATADEGAIATIMRYFDEGFRFAREWMADMDVNLERLGEKHVLGTDFMWIVGSQDISCPSHDLGWQEFVGEGNQVEILIYPGDHFFQVENPEADKAVATDVARGLLRKLQAYSWGLK